MFQLPPVVLTSVLGLVGYSIAQQVPLPVTYDTILKSPINPNITISYKKPEPGTCTTAFPTQKQYSGYVNLPPFTLEPYQQNYSINTFFWFFEARNHSETAPLTIWLNGGPGSSSMIGLFREAGPCHVVQLPDGSFGTQANIWGWDRSSNLLFIDQPTQVGFSYDEAVNVSTNLITGAVVDALMPRPQDKPYWSFLNGTFASGEMDHTQNSTVIAARAAWHFLQGFLSAFPQYNPGQHPNRTTTEPTGINLFAESYGGQYGPTFADFFEDQNERRRAGTIPANSTLEIKLNSLGIINGLVDALIQAPSLASFTFNNTYGIQAIDQTQYLNLLSDFRAPNGCQSWVTQCRERMKASDPEGETFDAATTAVCVKAGDLCYALIGKTLQQAGRNAYDIRVTPPSSFPNYAYLEYLNNAEVLQSIGAKVNYSEISFSVYNAFEQTGDVVRGTQLQKLAELLARDVRVAFIYGDADIICNWVGGEAVSLEVARLSSYNATFPAAGYADIVSNASYVGGQVRQHGNLSFSRIYDAGHTVPSYQGETAFVVFSRIIQGDDIGMGHDVDLSKFGSKGSDHSYHTNKVPPQPESTCWIRAVNDTCDNDQKADIYRGLGVVKNGMWFAQNNEHSSVSSSPLAGKPGSLPGHDPTADGKPTTTSIIPLTGVYTATGTPTPTSGASRLLLRTQPKRRREIVPIIIRHGDDGVRHVRKGLIGGLAGLGGLLTLLGILMCVCIGWRRHRYKKYNRKFLGGPRETPSPMPTSAPTTPPLEKTPKSKKWSLAQRFASVRAKTTTFENEQGLSSVPLDIERQEDLPPSERRPSRRLSVPMEPIPEAHSPRPSVDHKPSPPLVQHIGGHPNEPIVAEEPTPPVERHASPPKADPEASLASEPARTRAPSQTSPRKDSASPQKPGQEPSPPAPIQRQNSKEQAPDQEDRAPTPPPRAATQPPPERAATAKVPERPNSQPLA